MLLSSLLAVTLALHGERQGAGVAVRPWPTATAADGQRRGRVVVTAPGQRPQRYQLLGLDGQGRSVGPAAFRATPPVVSVGRDGRRLVAVAFDPMVVRSICAEGKALASTVNPATGQRGLGAIKIRSCKRV